MWRGGVGGWEGKGGLSVWGLGNLGCRAMRDRGSRERGQQASQVCIARELGRWKEWRRKKRNGHKRNEKQR